MKNIPKNVFSVFTNGKDSAYCDKEVWNGSDAMGHGEGIRRVACGWRVGQNCLFFHCKMTAHLK